MGKVILREDKVGGGGGLGMAGVAGRGGGGSYVRGKGEQHDRRTLKGQPVKLIHRRG